MSYVSEILPPLLQGVVVSVELFVITGLALPLGLPFAFGEMSCSRPIRWICKVFVVFRGTPLMLQLFFFFFFPLVLNIDIPAFPAAKGPLF